MQRGRLPYILIPLTALIPVLPLIVYGCSCGHDFDFHIVNWLEAAHQFTHGTLMPRWAFTPAFNAGEPRFVFYPPLSWTLGAMLGLIFPWVATPILYTWIVLTAAGLSLHRLASTFASPTASLLASIFYLVNPYTLFTAYERTAYAELLAAVWIPLFLLAILRPADQGGVTIPRIALPIALLWLTNAPAAVMACYALVLLTFCRLIFDNHRRLHLVLTTAAGTALGLGAASFYLVPAAYERRYVQIAMAILPNMSISNNFLFDHLPAPLSNPEAVREALFHDAVLRTASVIALLLLALTFAALFAAVLHVRRNISLFASETRLPLRLTLYALVVLTLTIAFLLIPISNFVWLYTPELLFLQFPWRLLALVAPTLSLALAVALTNVRISRRALIAVSIILAAALTLPAYATFRQPCNLTEAVSGRVALFHSPRGTEPTDEYTPITADNDTLAQTNPPYWLSPNPNALAPPNTKPGPAPADLRIDSSAAQALILNLRNYPAWHITLNDATIIPDPEYEREDGLITFPVPAGPSHLVITYKTLPDQMAGTILTALSLAALTVLLLSSRKWHSAPNS